jgi:hypothetical protein
MNNFVDEFQFDGPVWPFTRVRKPWRRQQPDGGLKRTGRKTGGVEEVSENHTWITQN